MDEDSSLFSMSIDPATREHLSETAKWARFLAIVGLISLFFITAFGIYTAIVLRSYEDMYGYNRRGVGNALGVGTSLIYLFGFLLYVFPIVFLLRFANKMKQALAANNQEALTTSFLNLKICFRYIGVVTIIGLVLMTLFIFIGLAGQAI
jgi:hypothetical protein